MNKRSDWEARRLTPEAILDRLIREMEKPIDWDADFTEHVKTQRSMGCSHITGEYMRPTWGKSSEKERTEEREKLIQFRNEMRGEEAAKIMAELGDRFHHFSLRSIDSRGHGPCVVYIYEKSETSPTGCTCAGSVDDCPEVRAAVGGRSDEFVGARCGEMSRFGK